MNCQQTVLLSRFKPPTAGYRQDKKSDEAHRVPITHPQWTLKSFKPLPLFQYDLKPPLVLDF